MTTTPPTIEAGPTDATPTGPPTRPGERSYDFDMPLGWPTGRYGPTTRRPVGEITSIDQYGNRAWLDADQG
jgi:hypothetical protein